MRNNSWKSPLVWFYKGNLRRGRQTKSGTNAYFRADVRVLVTSITPI
jgi:hypothetical protein